MHRLITLSFSHYNEKARWALDRFAMPYHEERYLPFFCSMAVAVATRGRGGAADRTSSRYSTPVLITHHGRVLTDSTDIVRFAAGSVDSSFLNDDVASLVDHYGDRLGPYTRLLSYWHVLRHPGMIEQLAQANVSPRQAQIFRLLMPLVRSNLKGLLNLTETSRDKAIARVREELDTTTTKLNQTQYLCGSHFTAADLTFGALLAPLLCVTPEEGYGAVLPSFDVLDAEARELVEEIRAHPAGKFALRMYAEERRRVV
jgi:glutathione S-transferase